MDATKIWITVTDNVINTEFRKYLVAGTERFSSNVGKIVKFEKVGLWTKKRGGNTNNSSSGLNAVQMQ